MEKHESEGGDDGGGKGGWGWSGDWSRKLSESVEVLKEQVKEQVEYAGKAFDPVEAQRQKDVEEMQARIRRLEAALRKLASCQGDRDQIETFILSVNETSRDALKVKREYQQREKELRRNAGAAVAKVREQAAEARAVADSVVKQKLHLQERLEERETAISRLEIKLVEQDNTVVKLREEIAEAVAGKNVAIKTAEADIRALKKKVEDLMSSNGSDLNMKETRLSQGEQVSATLGAEKPDETVAGNDINGTDHGIIVEDSTETAIGASEDDPTVLTESSGAKVLHSRAVELGKRIQEEKQRNEVLTNRVLELENQVKQERNTGVSSDLLVADLEGAKTAIEAMKWTVQNAEAEKKSLTMLVQELTENRDSLTAKLKSLSKTTSQLTTSLTAREKEVNELKMRLEEERNRDGEAVETANKKVKSIEERASQLENALRKEILRQQNKVASANSALATADAKFDSLSEELGSQLRTAKEQTARVEHLESEIAKERLTAEDLRSSEESLQREHLRFKERAKLALEQREQAAESLRTANESLRLELEKLQSEQIKEKNVEQENTDLYSLLDKSKYENNRLCVRVKELETALSEAVSKLSEMERKIRDVEERAAGELAAAETRLNELELLTKKMQTAANAELETRTEEKMLHLRSDNAKMEAKLRGVQRELRKLSQAAVEVEAERARLPKDYAVKMSDLSDENHILKSELARLNLLLIETMQSKDLLGGLAPI